MRQTLRVCLVILILFMAGTSFASAAGATVTASPTSVSFGSVTINTSSSSATIVLKNIGSRSSNIQSVSCNLSQFVVTGPSLPYSLPSGQSVSFQVVFKPTSAATASGKISFRVGRHSYSSIVVSLSGTGVNATSSHLLSSVPAQVSIVNVPVGSSSSQNATLTNTGTGSVTLNQITATGTGFTASGVTLPATLQAGQTATVKITFSPATAGTSTGTLTVVSDATNSPNSVALSGTAVQPQISVVPSSISFGSVTVGVTNTQTVTVRNPGTASLSVTQANVTGTGFAASGISLPLTVAPGASSAFTISFNPASAATTAGTLALVSNAPTPSISVMLSGTGVAAVGQISANPTSVNFGSVTLQTNASQTVTLTNTGNSSVSLSQISIAGAGFSQTGLTMPLSLAAGQSTTFKANFDPATSGNSTGTATIVSNATNSPTAIALSGTGAAAATHTVDLTWGASTSAVAGYNVYIATQNGGPYSKLNSALLPSTSYSDSNVVSGQTYYFVTTAVDSSGMESSYSNQVSALIP